MATFRDREVFEFCEKNFEELKRQDNGYFPHKHDKEVFNRASAQFGIGVEEVDKIYDSYTKVAAKLEIMFSTEVACEARMTEAMFSCSCA